MGFFLMFFLPSFQYVHPMFKNHAFCCSSVCLPSQGFGCADSHVSTCHFVAILLACLRSYYSLFFEYVCKVCRDSFDLVGFVWFCLCLVWYTVNTEERNTH